MVTKVRSIQGALATSRLLSSRKAVRPFLTRAPFPADGGFYGVTYCLGFRDDFLMSIGDIVERICTLEARVGANDGEADVSATIKDIRAAAKNSTHMYVRRLSRPCRMVVD